jgi:mRNA interferase MazF
MIREGQVVLFRFPHTSQVAGKLRPALIIRKVPGPHERLAHLHDFFTAFAAS